MSLVNRDREGRRPRQGMAYRTMDICLGLSWGATRSHACMSAALTSGCSTEARRPAVLPVLPARCSPAPLPPPSLDAAAADAMSALALVLLVLL